MTKVEKIVFALEHSGFTVKVVNNGTKIVFDAPNLRYLGEVYVSPMGAVNVSHDVPLKTSCMIYEAIHGL